ncbi:unnamed protein product [Pleuronectes platessa]|uniref:Uncharacterized protein n=1 Tax=Pleuronectes platessa TaxID=8262 RepID=A0A9N7Z6N0_PLEPL|nr:unnamed protein product [Pleuronectes platessa]
MSQVSCGQEETLALVQNLHTTSFLGPVRRPPVAPEEQTVPTRPTRPQRQILIRLILLDVLVYLCKDQFEFQTSENEDVLAPGDIFKGLCLEQRTMKSMILFISSCCWVLQVRPLPVDLYWEAVWFDQLDNISLFSPPRLLCGFSPVMTSLLFPGHAHAAMKDLSSSSSPLTTLLHYPSSKTSAVPFSPSAGPASSPGATLSSAPLSKPQPFCLQTGPHLIASMQLQKLNSHYQNLTGASAGHPPPAGAPRGFGPSPLGSGNQLLGPTGGLGGGGITMGTQSAGDRWTYRL